MHSSNAHSRLLFLFCALVSVASSAQPWLQSAEDPPGQRAAALLAAMTLPEKITLLHGVDSPGYTGMTAPIPRLNIPALTLNDGRNGFRPNSGSKTNTAFPCAVSVVASFDRELMRAFGVAMAEEFRCKGSNVMLAPMLILARVPLDGRIFESTGADPELAHAFAFNMISGVQSVPGVIANADDFVLNNQEYGRTSVSAVCDERTRFELYYRGYKGAIESGVGSFMCSYNKVSGVYACENNVTLGDLKNPAGLNFSGWVLSDWGGTHSTIPAALAGLDQEMPGGGFFGAPLLAAAQSGAVPLSIINDKVLRVLTPMFRAGLFDGAAVPNATQNSNCTSAEHTATARSLASAGTVLLANSGLLPFNVDALRTLLVVGDDGDVSPQCCGDGSGYNNPPYIVSPYAGLAARAEGTSLRVSYLPTPPVYGALTQFYSPLRLDHFLDFTCFECTPEYVPLRVEGFAPATAAGDASLPLWLWYDETALSNVVTTDAFPPPASYSRVRIAAFAFPANYSGPVATTPLELWGGEEGAGGGGGGGGRHATFFTLATAASRAEAAAANLSLVGVLGRLAATAVTPSMAAVAAAAAAADAVVVCVSTPSSEGSDRPNLRLAPWDDALVEAVLGAQQKTVVVLNSPGAIVAPWAPLADAGGAIVAAMLCVSVFCAADLRNPFQPFLTPCAPKKCPPFCPAQPGTGNGQRPR